MDALETLITQTQASDTDLAQGHAAFEELVHRFQDMAYGYAYAILGDTHLAQDAAQAAFITAYQSLQQLKEPAAFPGWFKRIVFTQCNRLSRQRHGSSQSIGDITELPSDRPGPPAIAANRELARQVQVAIRALPDTQRVATVLYYINGYSQREVAEFLAVPVNTVKKRLQRARQRLRIGMVEMVRDNLQGQRPSRGDQLVQGVLLSTVLDARASDAQYDMVEQMLVDGLDANATDDEGQTLLHWAARLGHLDAAELLVKNGADPTIADRFGRTPLQVAREKRHRQVVEFLRQNREEGESSAVPSPDVEGT